MPLYELECTNENCKHEFTEIQKIKDKDKAICPECGSRAKVVIRTNPLHFRHVSWGSWKVGMDGSK